ncbi:MAG: hypothetical protein ACON5F_02095 [Jejuia sp.]
MFKTDLIIKEPIKPLVNKVIVALLYTCLFGYTIYLFAYRNFWDNSERWTVIIYLVTLLLILFFSSFRAIASHHIHLNFKELKIQHQYSVGIFRYKELWQDVVNPKYISVFNEADYCMVNLWYDKLGILNLMLVEDAEKAMENGLLIADKLGIDLLDARKRSYHKWVDKEAYRETGEIKYIN